VTVLAGAQGGTGEAPCDRTGPVSAAGTLPRPPWLAYPSPSRRLWLALEMTAVFVLLPLAMMYAIYTWRVPLWAALFPVLVGILAFLLLDSSFHLRKELSRGIALRDLGSILALCAAGAGLMALWVWHTAPEQLLAMPRNRPAAWRKVITNYPIFSVLVQEFVYRTLFFHRYGPLFGDRRWLAVVLSGVLFGFGHIIFKNWVAVAGTLLTGLLFAWRYERTRSFWAVWLEHTLWGWIVFTIGLGGFFFTGVKTGWKLWF
jgi:membrane protease YdiL (CAAX protease family)